MVPFLDRVLFLATSGGTGTFTVSGPVTGYQAPGAAGAIDGFVYNYMAQSADLSQWEIGTGTYTASGTTLSRTTIYANSLATTAAINFSNAPVVSITPLHNDFRMLLSANTTFYVRSDGSDSNSGLVDSAAGAWATFSHAMSFIGQYVDSGGFTVTVKFSLGPSLTSQLNVNASPVGSGQLIIDLGGGSVQTTSAHAILLNAFDLNVKIQNGTIGTTTSGDCINISNFPTQVALGSSVTFNSAAAGASYHVNLNAGGAVFTCFTNYTISGAGGANAHIRCGPGSFVDMESNTVTLSGSPVFPTGFVYTDGGNIISFNQTFSGAAGATTPRYNAQLNGVIQTFGGGASYFPGTSAGTTATGGQYA